MLPGVSCCLLEVATGREACAGSAVMVAYAYQQYTSHSRICLCLGFWDPPEIVFIHNYTFNVKGWQLCSHLEHPAFVSE
jgi:hypothetical protein